MKKQQGHKIAKSNGFYYACWFVHHQPKWSKVEIDDWTQKIANFDEACEFAKKWNLEMPAA